MDISSMTLTQIVATFEAATAKSLEEFKRVIELAKRVNEWWSTSGLDCWETPANRRVDGLKEWRDILPPEKIQERAPLFGVDEGRVWTWYYGTYYGGASPGTLVDAIAQITSEGVYATGMRSSYSASWDDFEEGGFTLSEIVRWRVEHALTNRLEGTTSLEAAAESLSATIS